MSSSSFSAAAAAPISSSAAAGPSSSSSGMDANGLSLLPFMATTLLNKTVVVELLSGHRVTGRLAVFDPKTMNITIDFIKRTEVKVSGGSSVTVSAQDQEGGAAEGATSEAEVALSVEGGDRWVANPRELKYLNSLFVRGSSIKFLDFEADAAHALLSSYPSY